MPEERTLGGVGTKVLFENDRVKVWELLLQPGERSDVHRHELDHLLIEIDGDRGGIETAVNIGTRPFHEIIVELKD